MSYRAALFSQQQGEQQRGQGQQQQSQQNFQNRNNNNVNMNNFQNNRRGVNYKIASAFNQKISLLQEQGKSPVILKDYQETYVLQMFIGATLQKLPIAQRSYFGSRALAALLSSLNETERKCILSFSYGTGLRRKAQSQATVDILFDITNPLQKQLCAKLVQEGFTFKSQQSGALEPHFSIRYKNIVEPRKKTLVMRGLPCEYIREGIGDTIIETFFPNANLQILQTYVLPIKDLDLVGFQYADHSAVYVEFQAPTSEWRLPYTLSFLLGSGERVRLYQRGVDPEFFGMDGDMYNDATNVDNVRGGNFYGGESWGDEFMKYQQRGQPNQQQKKQTEIYYVNDTIMEQDIPHDQTQNILQQNQPLANQISNPSNQHMMNNPQNNLNQQTPLPTMQQNQTPVTTANKQQDNQQYYTLDPNCQQEKINNMEEVQECVYECAPVIFEQQQKRKPLNSQELVQHNLIQPDAFEKATFELYDKRLCLAGLFVWENSKCVLLNDPQDLQNTLNKKIPIYDYLIHNKAAAWERILLATQMFEIAIAENLDTHIQIQVHAATQQQ